ncbi:dihydrofolate reductase family protein [Amycolatopsis sp. OK19-0408]|uniref:Dihydrofolate reductase family protein n=1 Tax=Amycolatopsis iheyensis TaxID=2945988 RepID=A0A9X2SJG7_9PSEU|nr:dihydrofolate reductase family protein [Amycolatopsis iheyensis]MCR6484434.1 dihydrofolate reductase family protein [Amycolatopsis iheyensis]
MGKVIAEISMSADGIVAGPDTSAEHRLGKDGDLLHEWMFEGSDADTEVSARLFDGTGAFVVGRTMFDVGVDPWGDDGTFKKPVFVVTNRPHEPVVKGPTTFTFVTDGPESALRQARAAAGEDNVVLMGGGTTLRQYLLAGLVDELRLHVVPLLFGAGVRLFDAEVGAHVRLERTAVAETPNATHLTFRVLR